MSQDLSHNLSHLVSFFCQVVELSITYDIFTDDSPEFDFPPVPSQAPPTSRSGAAGAHGSVGSYSSAGSDPSHKVCVVNNRSRHELVGTHVRCISKWCFAPQDTQTSVRVRGGNRKWAPGFHPDVTCLLLWTDGEAPSGITTLTVSSRYGL